MSDQLKPEPWKFTGDVFWDPDNQRLLAAMEQTYGEKRVFLCSEEYLKETLKKQEFTQ